MNTNQNSLKKNWSSCSQSSTQTSSPSTRQPHCQVCGGLRLEENFCHGPQSYHGASDPNPCHNGMHNRCPQNHQQAISPFTGCFDPQISPNDIRCFCDNDNSAMSYECQPNDDFGNDNMPSFSCRCLSDAPLLPMRTDSECDTSFPSSSKRAWAESHGKYAGGYRGGEHEFHCGHGNANSGPSNPKSRHNDPCACSQFSPTDIQEDDSCQDYMRTEDDQCICPSAFYPNDMYSQSSSHCQSDPMPYPCSARYDKEGRSAETSSSCDNDQQTCACDSEEYYSLSSESDEGDDAGSDECICENPESEVPICSVCGAYATCAGSDDNDENDDNDYKVECVDSAGATNTRNETILQLLNEVVCLLQDGHGESENSECICDEDPDNLKKKEQAKEQSNEPPDADVKEEAENVGDENDSPKLKNEDNPMDNDNENDKENDNENAAVQKVETENGDECECEIIELIITEKLRGVDETLPQPTDAPESQPLATDPTCPALVIDPDCAPCKDTKMCAHYYLVPVEKVEENKPINPNCYPIVGIYTGANDTTGGPPEKPTDCKDPRDRRSRTNSTCVPCPICASTRRSSSPRHDECFCPPPAKIDRSCSPQPQPPQKEPCVKFTVTECSDCYGEDYEQTDENEDTCMEQTPQDCFCQSNDNDSRSMNQYDRRASGKFKPCSSKSQKEAMNQRQCQGRSQDPHSCRHRQATGPTLPIGYCPNGQKGSINQKSEDEDECMQQMPQDFCCQSNDNDGRSMNRYSQDASENNRPCCSKGASQRHQQQARDLCPKGRKESMTDNHSRSTCSGHKSSLKSHDSCLRNSQSKPQKQVVIDCFCQEKSGQMQPSTCSDSRSRQTSHSWNGPKNGSRRSNSQSPCPSSSFRRPKALCGHSGNQRERSMSQKRCSPDKIEDPCQKFLIGKCFCMANEGDSKSLRASSIFNQFETAQQSQQSRPSRHSQQSQPSRQSVKSRPSALDEPNPQSELPPDHDSQSELPTDDVVDEEAIDRDNVDDDEKLRQMNATDNDLTTETSVMNEEEDDVGGEGEDSEKSKSQKGSTTTGQRPSKSPKGKCDCCHCRAVHNRSQAEDPPCTSVSRKTEPDDNCTEFKYFIDSIITDLEAMENARRIQKKDIIRPPAAQPPISSSRNSFPVTISDVQELGNSSLYVKWIIHDCTGIGGYEIYIDGHLTNRYFHCNHEAAVICDVDVTSPHKICLIATPKKTENIDYEKALCLCSTKAKSIFSAKSVKPPAAVWIPSVYLYDPNDLQYGPPAVKCAC